MFENSAVKAVGEMVLEVLGLPFGTDRQGQVFDRSTDIGLTQGDEIPALYYHGFAERAAKSVKRLGRAVYSGVTDAGHMFRVTLDAAHEKAQDVYDAAKAGAARASSDSSAHLVRPHGIVGKPGHVSAWPIFALSLMDEETANAAVNPRAVAMAAAKALFEEVDAEDSGEDAAKAGRTFNMKNRERLKAMKATLDEMLMQIDEEEPIKTQNDATVYDGVTAAKGDIVEDNKQAEAAPQNDEMSAVKAQLADLEKRLVEAQRPAFNINTGKGSDSADAKADIAAKAFEQYMRYGDASAFKAANETTAADGGYLVPRSYSNELITSINEGSVLRTAGARVLNISGTNSFRVPTMTNATTAAIIKAESTSFSEEYPTIGEVEFTPFKYTALSLATDELLADSRIDVFNQVLAPDAVNRFIKAENTDFATGGGSSAPQGVMIGGQVGVTAAATNAITADEIIDTYHSLKTEYRGRAVWLMNDATLKVIRKFRESSTTGAYLWQPGLAQGQPDTILGRPVYTLSTVDTIATGKKVIAFGDMSYFWIADFGGLSFQRLNERYADIGQIGFRWYKRMDSNVMLAEAIKYLKNA
jgi:HK97 family phage major capsid protein